MSHVTCECRTGSSQQALPAPTKRRYRASARQALLAALLATLTAPFSSSYATPVDADALFLAPSSISEDYYSTHMLSLGSSTVVSQFYSTADLGGASITGVHILPLLNPNPVTSEGEYSSADLGAITAANYSSYFYRQPGSAYTADLTSNAVRVDYQASGQYFVRIDALDAQGHAFSTVYHDQVDDFFAEDPAHGVKDKASVSRVIDTPSADLILISKDPTDNGAMKNAKETYDKAGTKYVEVGSVADVKKAIEDAYKANGNKKISVALIAHGFGLPKGGVKVGGDYITSIPGYTSPGDFQKMIDPWTNAIQFVSCNTGQDKSFLQAVADSVGKATGYETTVTMGVGFFDVGAGAKKAIATAVPEADTMVLAFVGLMVVMGAQALRDRRARMVMPLPMQ